MDTLNQGATVRSANHLNHVGIDPLPLADNPTGEGYAEC